VRALVLIPTHVRSPSQWLQLHFLTQSNAVKYSVSPLSQIGDESTEEFNTNTIIANIGTRHPHEFVRRIWPRSRSKTGGEMIWRFNDEFAADLTGDVVITISMNH
jgi:hypothetical protein